ncbi:aldo/keto reductase [Cellulomonas sp. Marseille-Q8402]
MPAATPPRLTLNNGISMPALGLGVFQVPPERTAHAVSAALSTGYRLVDTAAAYFNEREVGDGIRRADVRRTEVFVTTKLWISDYGTDRTRRALEDSLDRLGLGYVDLYLLHQPLARDFSRTVRAYLTAQQLLREGQVRAIGVANFMPEHLTRLRREVDVAPAVNQVEVHPLFAQRDVQQADGEAGTVTQAWSPLGGVRTYGARRGSRATLLADPRVVAIASAHGRTPAQVVLRWHLQQGRAVVPKSVRAERIAENARIFDFQLSPDEMATIDAMETGVRGGPDPARVSRRSVPLTIGRGLGWRVRRGVVAAAARRPPRP